MKRVIFKTRDYTVNIEATTMKVENGMVYIYNAEDLVGVIDCGELLLIYLTERRGA